jgi:hypothetical protein
MMMMTKKTTSMMMMTLQAAGAAVYDDDVDVDVDDLWYSARPQFSESSYTLVL